MWLSKMTTWARFCIVTFMPWDDSLRQRLRDPLNAVDAWVSLALGSSSDVNLSRYSRVEHGLFNSTVSLRQSHIDKTLCTSFRMRAIDQWKDYGVHAPRPPFQSRKVETRIDEALDFVRALASGTGSTVSQISVKLSHALSHLLHLPSVAHLPVLFSRPCCVLHF